MASPSPERHIELLTSLQRLLSEGLFVATYKYSLQMALAGMGALCRMRKSICYGSSLCRRLLQ
jgi:hypothetical protein